MLRARRQKEGAAPDDNLAVRRQERLRATSSDGGLYAAFRIISTLMKPKPDLGTHGARLLIIGENTTYDQSYSNNAPYLMNTMRPKAAWLT